MQFKAHTRDSCLIPSLHNKVSVTPGSAVLRSATAGEATGSRAVLMLPEAGAATVMAVPVLGRKVTVSDLFVKTWRYSSPRAPAAVHCSAKT